MVNNKGIHLVKKYLVNLGFVETSDSYSTCKRFFNVYDTFGICYEEYSLDFRLLDLSNKSVEDAFFEIKRYLEYYGK